MQSILNRIAPWLICGLICLAPAAVFADGKVFEPYGLHGYAMTRNYLDRQHDNDTESWYESRSTLRVESSGRLNAWLKYLISLNTEYDAVYSTENEFFEEDKRFELWEGYLNYYLSGLNLRVGKQIIRWGKGDEINPTDNFTPEDTTEFVNLDRADRKLPLWMFRADYGYQTFQIKSIWIPIFEPHRMPPAGSDWEPSAYRTLRNNPPFFRVHDPRKPEETLDNSIVAAKVIANLQDVDLSLSYAYHFQQLPTLHIDPTRRVVEQTYERRQTVGSDMETNFGAIGARGEFAYTFDETFYSAQVPGKLIQSDVLRGVAGIDYSRSDSYANIQYYGVYICNDDSEISEPRYTDHLILKLSRKMIRDRLFLEGRMWLALHSGDLFYKLQAMYKIHDKVAMTVGYDDFQGEPGGLFGQFENNDQFYLKIKLTF